MISFKEYLNEISFGKEKPNPGVRDHLKFLLSKLHETEALKDAGLYVFLKAYKKASLEDFKKAFSEEKCKSFVDNQPHAHAKEAAKDYCDFVSNNMDEIYGYIKKHEDTGL